MSARDTAEEAGADSASRGMMPAAGMSATDFAFFAVGARITQLLMLNDLVEREVSSGGTLVTEDLMVRQAYAFVATAFERLAQALGLSQEMARRGHEIIAEGRIAWNSCTKVDDDHLGNTVLCMGELESIVRDLSASLGAAGVQAREWFELGLVVPEGEGDASDRNEQRAWAWDDPQRVEQQLKSLGLRHEDVIPDSPGPKHGGGGWIILPGRFSGWNKIEVGLTNLSNRISARTSDEESVPTAPEHPVWDAKRGQLRWGEQVIRRVRVMGRPSSIQKILDAFEAAGWPSRIDDPIAQGKQPDQVRQIVLTLNNGLELIRFHVQEAGRAITWSRQ